MKPLISVIIPVYNVEEYIDECLESIVNQTYKNLEIILVDDGSPDRCPQICDEWAKRDNRIKVVHQQNKGLSGARNAGLDVCTGEYIGFIDSDDWIDKQYYEILYKNMQDNNADISMIGVQRVYDNYRLDRSEISSAKAFTGKEALHDFLYFKNNMAGGTVEKLFKKEHFSELRFPLGLTGEDRYTNVVLYSKVNRIYFDPKPLYFYRIHENSICTSGLNAHTFDRVKITEKVCNYLEEINYADVRAMEYFMMKANHDILYRLICINADSKYINEYKINLRKHYWKTMKNPEVSIGFKLKFTFTCIAPQLYEKLKEVTK